jgi:hypothetical protein
MTTSYISETRRPFERKHDQGCVYYGIRGNTRNQYMFDKSCALEGAGLGERMIQPTGALWAGLGDEVINRVGVLYNGAVLGTGVMPVIEGPLPTLLGSSGVPQVTLLGDAMPTLLGPIELLGDPMSTSSKVLLGLGAIGLIAGAAYAFRSKGKKSGGRRRRRR